MSLAGLGGVLYGEGGALFGSCACCDGGGPPPSCPTSCAGCPATMCFTFVCDGVYSNVEYTRELTTCVWDGNDGSQIQCITAAWRLIPASGSHYWSASAVGSSCPPTDPTDWVLHRTDPDEPCPDVAITSISATACSGGPCASDYTDCCLGVEFHYSEAGHGGEDQYFENFALIAAAYAKADGTTDNDAMLTCSGGVWTFSTNSSTSHLPHPGDNTVWTAPADAVTGCPPINPASWTRVSGTNILDDVICNPV